MSYDIRNEDCLKGMKRLASGSIDAIICDLPFETTDCAFDKKLPQEEMWAEFARVTKENAAIVLFSQMPFGAELIMSSPIKFRYEWVYTKPLPVGFLNAKKMPMRSHENILVFYRKLPTYNAQMRNGKAYRRSAQCGFTENYRQHARKEHESEGERYPVDVLRYRQPYCEGNGSWHPQEKPIGLLEYLIQTYTNAGETVLDATMGSGSTGVAAVNTGRNFIGFELEQKFYEIAKRRLKTAEEQKARSEKLMSRAELRIEEKKLAELVPYENNPRENEGAVSAVAKSISEFGFQVPLVISVTGEIVCGHTRYKAAQRLGLEKVPCVVADDLTAEELKEFRIVDNKTHEMTEWTKKELAAELTRLTTINLQEYGFGAKELKAAEIKMAELSAETCAESEKMQFVMHKKQAELVKKATKKKKVYEIIREWQEGK